MTETTHWRTVSIVDGQQKPFALQQKETHGGTPLPEHRLVEVESFDGVHP